MERMTDKRFHLTSLVEILTTSLEVVEEAKSMRLSISKQLETFLKDYRCEECLREENKSKLVYNQKRLSIYDDLIVKLREYLE